MSRKIKITIILFLIAFIWFLQKPNSAVAQASCTCNSWIYNYYWCPSNGQYPLNSQCSTATCADPGNNCTTSQCGPGTYPSNNGCHPYGPPAPTNNPGPNPTTAPTPAPGACYVTTSPSSWNLLINQSQTISASVTSGLGSASVIQMVFGSYAPSIATVNPDIDTTSTYSTTVRAISAGSTAVWATAVLTDGRICQQAAGGTTDTDVNVTTPTCTISLTPGTTNLTAGSGSGTVTANVSCTGPIDRVDFSSSNPSIAIVSPASDTTSPYSTTVTGVSTGAVVITGTAISSGIPSGTSTAVVNVAQIDAWFQAKDADILSGADLNTNVGSGKIFGLNGPGGFPGIPVYKNTTDLNAAKASNLGWIAQNTVTNQKIVNYQSLISQIPADTIINTLSSPTVTSADFNAANSSYGYTWYKYSGNGGLPLTINGAVDFGTKKVILLVDSADLQINGPINLTDGQGFFMVLVGKTSSGARGNITIGSGVGGNAPQANPNLEGIYEADGSFNNSTGNTQLWVRGSVVAYNGATLARDLTVNNFSTPAEIFEFAPDLMLLYPNKLGIRRLNWKEVAP